MRDVAMCRIMDITIRYTKLYDNKIHQYTYEYVYYNNSIL